MNEKPRTPKPDGAFDAEAPVLLAATPNHAFGYFGDVFVVMWRVLTTIEGARELQSECERFALARPNGIGLFTIIETRAPMPEVAARRAIAEFMRAGGSYIRGCAVVFEGNTLQASAVRSVATGIALLARHPYPQKFFSDARRGAEFLARTLSDHGRPTSAEALLADLSHVRDQVADWDREQFTAHK